MSNTFIIVSGGFIDDTYVKSVISQNEGCIIGVDKGMECLYRNGITPNYILGDFDSVSEEIAAYYKSNKVSVKQLDPVKNASDTEVALRLAITMGAKRILLLGATGGRLDHLWANVQSLMIPLKKGVEACIMDEQNRIRLFEDAFEVSREDAFGTYFSLFALGEDVHGLTLGGAKYPLKNYTLSTKDSCTVSNEFEADKIHISFYSGVVIFMETKDDIT